MGDRSMLFSGPMVRALAREADAPGAGKTQTRRIINPQPKPFKLDSGEDCEVGLLHIQGSKYPHITLGRLIPGQTVPYFVGQKLWVREAWRTEARNDDIKPSRLRVGLPVYYEAGDFEATPECAGRLRPSIFMPRWASRLTLAVMDVRVERLNDISEEDAIAEGINEQPAGWWSGADGQSGTSPRAAYALLWNSLHGPGAWSENPFVAAVSFTVTHANIDSLPKSEAA